MEHGRMYIKVLRGLIDQRMIYTKEMKESLSGQDNRYAFMNLILGKDPGLFYIKNLFIEELAW